MNNHGIHQPIEEPVLLIRCAAQQAPDLNSYLEGGGFVGASTAADMSPLEVITTLRQAALRGRGQDGHPVFLKWFDFSQAQGPGVLVVDARQADPRGQSHQALILGNPFGLLEGLCIAALALGVSRVRVLLPPGSQDQRDFLQTALRQYLDYRPLEEQTPALELLFSDDAAQAPGDRVLKHSLETWHQVTLVFILGVERFLKQGMNGQGGTRLVTVGGAVNKPGLVEVPMGAHLWQVLDAAGGLSQPTSFQALSLDQGRSGFLSLEAAATPIAPEELISAWINPGFGTLWALGDDCCMVELTRQALDGLGPRGDDQADGDQALAQAYHLVEGLSQGAGQPQCLERLMSLGRDLKRQGSAAAWPLGSALLHFAAHWRTHQETGVCLTSAAVAPDSRS